MAGWVAGRSFDEIVAPYFAEVVAATRSELFDTIGHLDYVKKYLADARAAVRVRRRARTSTSRSSGRSSRRGRAWR